MGCAAAATCGSESAHTDAAPWAADRGTYLLELEADLEQLLLPRAAEVGSHVRGGDQHVEAAAIGDVHGYVLPAEVHMEVAGIQEGRGGNEAHVPCATTFPDFGEDLHDAGWYL